MQENPESQEKKVTRGNFFEAPGTPKEEPGVRYEGKNEEEVYGSPTSLEREEPKKSEFKPQGELETGYTRESWEKPEEMEEKEATRGPTLEERNIPKESQFKAPGELETGYTRESWEKPGGMEKTSTIEQEGKREEKASEEAKEEKHTTYTMKKRLVKSKKDRMLFGVCGGLGEYFGIDPTFIRLAFAALALQGGIGIILYIILAIIMPSGGQFEMVSSTQGNDFKR